MKKFLSISWLLVLTMFQFSCSNVKSDGIYQTDNGWDIVEGGKTYSYSCEPDGLYLYLDWEGKNLYTLAFKYKSEIYRKTVGHTDNYSATLLKFLCKNKDGKYVYVAGWDEFDGCFYDLNKIGFQVDDSPGQIFFSYTDMKDFFSLMDKYTSN